VGTGAILYGQYATAKAEATRLTDAVADALSREAAGHEGVPPRCSARSSPVAGVLTSLDRYGLSVADIEAAIRGEEGANDHLHESLSLTREEREALGLSTKELNSDYRAMARIVEGLAGGEAERDSTRRGTLVR
jgi:hypothetical protein